MSKCHLSACSIIQLRSDLEINTRKMTSTWKSSWQIETTSDYSFNDMIIAREEKKHIIIIEKKTNKYEQIEIIRNELLFLYT